MKGPDSYRLRTMSQVNISELFCFDDFFKKKKKVTSRQEKNITFSACDTRKMILSLFVYIAEEEMLYAL